MTFGDALKTLLEAKNIHGTKLADEIGIPYPRLLNWMNNRASPKLMPCKKISRALGMTLDEFAAMIDDTTEDHNESEIHR